MQTHVFVIRSIAMDNEPLRIASLSRGRASTGQLIVLALLVIALSLAAALALALSGLL